MVSDFISVSDLVRIFIGGGFDFGAEVGFGIIIDCGFGFSFGSGSIFVKWCGSDSGSVSRTISYSNSVANSGSSANSDSFSSSISGSVSYFNRLDIELVSVSEIDSGFGLRFGF